MHSFFVLIYYMYIFMQMGLSPVFTTHKAAW